MVAARVRSRAHVPHIEGARAGQGLWQPPAAPMLVTAWMSLPSSIDMTPSSRFRLAREKGAGFELDVFAEISRRFERRPRSDFPLDGHGYERLARKVLAWGDVARKTGRENQRKVVLPASAGIDSHLGPPSPARRSGDVPSASRLAHLNGVAMALSPLPPTGGLPRTRHKRPTPLRGTQPVARSSCRRLAGRAGDHRGTGAGSPT